MARIGKTTKRYPSDLTDEEWASVQVFLPQAATTGSARRVDLRDILNAIRYLVRSGCEWRMLPIHFPPWIRHLFGDSACDRQQLLDTAAFLGFTLEIIQRTEAAFKLLPRRWVVERTFGWMTREVSHAGHLNSTLILPATSVRAISMRWSPEKWDGRLRWVRPR